MRRSLRNRIKLEYGDKSQISFLLEHNLNFYKVWHIWFGYNVEDSKEVRDEKQRIIKAIKIQMLSALIYILIVIYAINLVM